MTERIIKVYSTPTCPWCFKAKKFLDTNNIKYEDLNVADNQEAKIEMMRSTHQMAVPAISIDGKFTIGFNEKSLKERLGLP